MAFAERQVIRSAEVEDVADIVVARAVAELEVAVRDEGTAGICLIAIDRSENQRMRQGIVAVEFDAVAQALPDFHLQRMVIGVAHGIQVIERETGGIRVHFPKVDGVGCSGSAEAASGARRELRAEHVAHIALVAGQRVGDASGLAGLKLSEELVIERAGGGSEIRGEDGQRRLARQSVVLETVAFAVCLIDRQVRLRILELVQEAVFEDVHFVQVFAEPDVVRHVADIADFESRALAELALDAEVPLLGIGLADIRIHGEEGIAERQRGRGERRRPGGREQAELRKGLAQGQRARLVSADGAGRIGSQVARLEEEGALVGSVGPEVLCAFLIIAQRPSGTDDGLPFGEDAAEEAP